MGGRDRGREVGEFELIRIIPAFNTAVPPA